MTSIIDFGAVGDGRSDDTEAFVKAFGTRGAELFIPAGHYTIGSGVKLESYVKITAAKDAVIKLADGACTKNDDYMLTNADHANGNSGILISGGLWDGNNTGNPAGGVWESEKYGGVMFNFINVRSLRLSGMRLHSARTYYVRLGEVNGFDIRDIVFTTETPTPNQDGVHLGGYCENGVIENLSAVGMATNDDMIALNADDAMGRVNNIGLKCGPIRHLRIKNVRAESCHCLLRVLSVFSEIADVRAEDIEGGCRGNALNMDAARYCLVPIFKDAEHPEGVGLVNDFSISRFTSWKTSCNAAPLLMLETNSRNFRVSGFRRLREREQGSAAVTLSAANTKVGPVVNGERLDLSRGKAVRDVDACEIEA